MKHRSERIFVALVVACIGFAAATIVESALRNTVDRDGAPTTGDGWRLVDRDGGDIDRAGKRLEIRPTERLSIGRDRAPFHFARVELEFERLRPNSDLDVALVPGTSGTNDSSDGEIFVRFGSSESFGVMIGKRGIDGSVKLVAQDKTPAAIRATSGARPITIRLDHDRLAVDVDGREWLSAPCGTDLELAAVDLVANGGEIAPRHARVQGRIDDDLLEVLVDPTTGRSPSKIALATTALATPLGFALFVLFFLAACTTALPPLGRLVLATGVALTPNALLRIAAQRATDGFFAGENAALVAAALGLLIGLVFLRTDLAARIAGRLENALRLALGAIAIAFSCLTLYQHAHEAFLPLESAERAAVKRVLHPEPESHAAIDLDAGNSLPLPSRIRDGDLDLRFTLDPDSILQVRLREARPSWPEGVSFFVSRDPRFESGFYLETRGDFVRLAGDLRPLRGDPSAEHVLHLEAVGRHFRATLDAAQDVTATTPLFPQGACRVLAARGRAHVNLARMTPRQDLSSLADGVSQDRRDALVDSGRALLLALLLSSVLALGLRLTFPSTLLLVGLAMVPLPIALSAVRASPSAGSAGHDELARAVVATLFLLLLPWITHAKRLRGARTIAFPIHLLLSLVLAQRGRALLDPPIHLVSDEFVSRMPMSHWSGDRLVDDLLWLTHPCFRRWNIYLANHSFRDRTHAVARVPDTLRVMCIGSSSTYGAEAKTPYPLGLEQLLHQAGRSVEVINAGVRGSVGNQLVRLLRDQLGQFQPDVVTVSLFYNDAYSLTQSDNEAYLQSVTEAGKGRDRFIDAKFEREIASGAERFRMLSSTMDESASAAAAALPDSPPARFERMLRRFIDLSRERDFRLVFIEEPVRGDEPHLWKKEFRAVMDRLGREFGLSVVDPTPAMQRRGGAKLFVDPIHPNEQGHAIVAETLLSVIEHELDRRAGR